MKRSLTMRSLGILLLAMMLFLTLSFPPCALGAKQDEYEVKAVFLLNFAKLTEWPNETPGEREPFTIAILGKVPSTAFMATLKAPLIHGSRTNVKRIESAAEARGARLVYISPSERPRITALLREFRQQDILTVSDMEGFCEAGGMIGLVRIQNRIGFEVNLAAVRRARLSVSSQLLKLARIIYGN